MRNLVRGTVTAVLLAVGFQTQVAVAEDIVTDPDLIRQAQEIMYNLNYDFGVPDGVNGPPTREVIRTLQKKLGHPVTGDLTERLLKQLKQQKIPTTWGAVSGAVDGGWGAVWNYKTRKAAEQKAADLCKAKSKKKCRVLAIYDQQCAAAYHWDGKKKWGWRGSSGNSMQIAKRDALADCRANRSEAVPCKLMTAICADGSHKKKAGSG